MSLRNVIKTGLKDLAPDFLQSYLIQMKWKQNDPHDWPLP